VENEISPIWILYGILGWVAFCNLLAFCLKKKCKFCGITSRHWYWRSIPDGAGGYIGDDCPKCGELNE